MSQSEGKSRKFTAENPYDKGDRSFHFRGKREKLSAGFGRTTDLDAVNRAVDLKRLHAKVDESNKKPFEIEKPFDASKSKDKEKKGKEIFNSVLDIFGDIETQKHYIDDIREILETPGFGDRLYDFIMANQTYQKSSYHKLNADWREILKFNPSKQYEGRNLRHTNMRIAAASQLLMVEYYKTHVFETEKKANLNPWRFADGKTGAYTVSVYAEYWKHKHSANSKRKDPNRSKLGSKYGFKADWENANTQLNSALQKSATKPTPPNTQETDSDTQDPADEMAENL